MKITSITSNYTSNQSLQTNNRQTNFTGLTKRLSHEVYIDGKKDILEIINKRDKDAEKNTGVPTHKNTYVGQLPPGMFYRLPEEKAERVVAIKEIMETFNECAPEIRKYIPDRNATRDEYRNKRPQSAVEKMRNIFEKYDLLDENEEFNIEYLGQGDYGKAFRLRGLKKDTVDDDEYVLKIYHTTDKGREWHRFKSHGCFAEPNIAAYWMKNIGRDTQRGKFYFANIDAGYMVTNFIYDGKPTFKREIDEYDYGLKLTDEALRMPNGHNKINGYSIDWGGVRVVNKVKNENRTARYVLRKVENAKPENSYRIWKDFVKGDRAKGMDKDGVNAGLTLATKCAASQPQLRAMLVYLSTLPGSSTDEARAYALKYYPTSLMARYFEKYMSTFDEHKQVRVMNEMPLLAKIVNDEKDNIDISKKEINQEKLLDLYLIAKKNAKGEAVEHLASYVHLLPKNRIMPEFNWLVNLHDNDVYDRLLHKMIIVQEDEYPLDTKLKMLDILDENVEDDFLKNKINKTRMTIIRRNLDDSD